MKVAALELVADITTQILAKGGSYVAVMTLERHRRHAVRQLAAGGAGAVGADRPVADLQPLAARRPDQPAGADHRHLRAVQGRLPEPGQVRHRQQHRCPACDAAKISAVTGGAVTDGSSLFCNATPGAPYNGLRTGADVNTWQFADSVHPTTGGHKIISDAFAAQLQVVRLDLTHATRRTP